MIKIYVYETEFEEENGMLYSLRPPTKRFWNEWRERKYYMKHEGWIVTRNLGEWEAVIKVKHLRTLTKYGNELFCLSPDDEGDRPRIKADLLISHVSWDGLTEAGTAPINLGMETMQAPLESFGFRFDDETLHLPPEWTVGICETWNTPVPIPLYPEPEPEPEPEKRPDGLTRIGDRLYTEAEIYEIEEEFREEGVRAGERLQKRLGKPA